MRRRSMKTRSFWFILIPLLAAAFGLRPAAGQPAADLERVRDFLLGLINLTPEELAQADVNQDSAVDVADIIALAGLPSPLPTLTFTPLPTPPMNPVPSGPVVAGPPDLGTTSADPSGALRHSIPLSLPAGLNLAPDLSVEYSSRVGDGPLGVGWIISGLSTIVRIPPTIEQDGYTHAVNLTDGPQGDRYAIDGQRLIATAGEYGADGTLYRTERNTFLKVISYTSGGPGPDRFRVWTPSGLIFDYGITPDSLIEAPGSNKRLAWAVSRIQDRVNDRPSNPEILQRGNYMEFKYLEEDGAFYPIEIAYTGNPVENLPPPNKVVFNYSLRTALNPSHPVPLSYIEGLAVRQKRLLDSIDVFVSSSRLHSYTFTYEQSQNTLRPRLKAVDTSNGTGSLRLPTIAFSWLPEGAGSFALDLTRTPSSATVVGADFTGDGRTDYLELTASEVYVHVSSVSGLDRQKWFTGTLHYPDEFRLGDFNGDGKMDLIAKNFGVLRSTGSSFMPSGPALVDVINAYFNNCQIVDANADGLADVCVTSPGGFSIFAIYVNNGSSFSGSALSFPDWFLGVRDTPAVSDILPGDFNADGRTDIVNVHPLYGIDIAFSTGTSFTFSHFDTPAGTPTSNFRAVAARCNADDLTDIIVFSGSPETAMVLFNTGTGFVAGPAFTGACSASEVNATGDINGDALTDIIHIPNSPSATTTAVSIARGDGTFACQIFPSDGLYALASQKEPIIGDFNGNARADIAVESGLWNNPGFPHDYIASVESPDLPGYSTTVEYLNLTHPDAYVQDSGPNKAVYPVQDLAAMAKVVSAISMKGKGDAIDQRQTFLYGGGKVHLKGRGFLGFRWRDVEDTRTVASGPIVRLTHTEYMVEKDNGFSQFSAPFSGMVAKEESYVDGILVSRVVNTWDAHTYATGLRWFPYLTKQDRYIFDPKPTSGLMFSHTTFDYSYDTSGNATLIDEIVRNGQGGFVGHKLTVNEFATSGTNFERWLMGRLTRTDHGGYLTADTSQLEKSRVVLSDYDEYTGQTVRMTEAPGRVDRELQVDSTYDNFGNVVRKDYSGPSIPNSSETWSFTPTGPFKGYFPVSHTDPEGLTETFDYDPRFKDVVRVRTSANGFSTTCIYDDFGRKMQENRSDGTWTAYSYGFASGGDPGKARYWIEQKPVGLPPARTFYDDANRVVLVETTGFSGGKVHQATDYDKAGRMTMQTRPYYAGTANPPATRYVYDNVDRPVEITDPTGALTRLQYDTILPGLLNTETRDANGRRSWKNVDARGNLVESRDAYLKSMTMAYDTLDHRIQAVDPAGNVWSWNTGAWGRVNTETRPDSGAVARTWDAFDRLKNQTDANGNVLNYAYDLAGRITQIVETNGTTGATDTTTREYDATDAAHGNGVGQLTRETKSNGIVVDYKYDADGLVLETTTTIDGEAFTIGYVRDPLRRIVRTTYPDTGSDPFAVDQIYNSSGYPVQLNTAFGIGLWRTDALNATGLIQSETIPVSGATNIYQYDAVDRTTGRYTGTTASGQAGILGLLYAYDGVGNVLFRNNISHGLNITETFTYDSIHRLKSFELSGPGLPVTGPTTFNYDDAGLGNFKTYPSMGVYTYGQNAGPHAVTSISAQPGKTISYDANGNMVDGLGLAIEWNASNLATRIAKGDDLANEFSYGPDNARFKQVVEETGKPDKTILYVGDLYERIDSEAGREHVLYIYAGGRRFAALTIRPGGASDMRFLHTDHLGSVTAISDETGQRIEAFGYDPFGPRRDGDTWLLPPADGPPLESGVTPRGFTDHEHLDDLGLIHMNGRIYHPLLGRFLSPDPIISDPENLQAYNAYSYVLNNPLNRTDPSGYEDIPIYGAGSIGGGGFHFSPGNDIWWEPIPSSVTPSWGFDTSSGVSGTFNGGWQEAAWQFYGELSGGAWFNDIDFTSFETFPIWASVGFTRSEINEDSFTPNPYVLAKIGLSVPTEAHEGWPAGEAVWYYLNYPIYDIGGYYTITPLDFAGGYGLARGLLVKGTTTLYRAVGLEEFAELMATKQFRSANTLGGKWFAESAEHAHEWGFKLNGPGKYRVIEVEFPKTSADSFLRRDRLDTIGPARYGEIDQINAARPIIRPYK